MGKILKKLRYADSERSGSSPEMEQANSSMASKLLPSGQATPGSLHSNAGAGGGPLGSGPNSTHSLSPRGSFVVPSGSFGARTPVSDDGMNHRLSHRPSWIDQREAYSIMASHLYKVAKSKNWFSEDPTVASAVALRLSRGQYAMCPAADPRLETFFQSLTILNPEVAMKVTSQVVSALTSRLAPGTTQVPLTSSDHVQVVETLQDLAGARKAQNAAFIRQDRSLVIWCDHVDRLDATAQALEDKMIAFVWKSAMSNKPGASVAHGDEDEHLSQWNHEQASHAGHGALEIEPHWVPSANSPPSTVFNEKEDAEAQAPQCEERPVNLQAPLFHGLAYALNLCLLGLMLRTLVQESLVDGQWLRMAIFASAPFLSLIMLFFCDNIIGVIGLLIAPIRHMSSNSRYYSGKAPKRISTQLPHITVQMPVYKESLEGVLRPTIESVKKAISTYELQGGTASIIVSEDGMKLLSEEDRAIRREYYEMNQIGWVARPGHNVDGYIRKGRFKKASNLNFTCRLSLAVERAMDEQRPTEGAGLANWTDADETNLYEACLELSLYDLHPSAEGAGNIRFGDLVLLIDSDTRVPEDCLLDAASEMAQCPDVGVLQHCSGVMLVTSSYFERGIGFFTRLVNFAISVTVSNGDIAPFMGHNAFLRWKAMQEASFVDPEDDVLKVWSESHVSEDFDMALRLIMKGYITRWATYSNNEFEEGVSLTCDDEINRWQKYAFGCSEMVFHPIWKWYKGPLTPLMRTFLWSSAPVHYKFSAISYIASYWAIALAIPFSIGLYLVQGWFAPVLDGAFFSPFQIWVGVVVVFIILGNVATVIGRYRAKQANIVRAAIEHVIWAPFMLVFFGGLAYHVLLALIAHITGYNMTWGATVKDLDDSNFFIEVPAILKRFWKMYIIFIAVLGGIVVMALDVLPLEWRIQDFTVFWPPILLASLHILYPIVLNPALLRFSF